MEVLSKGPLNEMNVTIQSYIGSEKGWASSGFDCQIITKGWGAIHEKSPSLFIE